MRFDIGQKWEETPPAPPAGERQIVPIGRHNMTIKHAEEGPNDYKRSDENPDGICLKLRLSDAESKYRFVFDDLPQAPSLAWRAKQLAVALGIDTSGETLDIDPDAIKGRTLEVDISHYTSKAGKVSAVVKRYCEPTQSSPAKRPARTVAAKVTESLDDDVVPF
jgi:hypothetical protein